MLIWFLFLQPHSYFIQNAAKFSFNLACFLGLFVNTILLSIAFKKVESGEKPEEVSLKEPYYRLTWFLLLLPYLCAFFLLILISVALSLMYLEHRRARQRVRFYDENPYGVEQVDELDPATIMQIAENYVNMLDAVTYSSEVAAQGDQEICPVCHLSYEKGEKLRKVAQCGHLFHEECIRKWFYSY